MRRLIWKTILWQMDLVELNTKVVQQGEVTIETVGAGDNKGSATSVLSSGLLR